MEEEYHKSYYERNKEYLRAYQRAYYYKKKAKIKNTKHKAMHKEKKKIDKNTLKYHYGKYIINFD